jgi:hypothetical protein
MKSVLVFFIFSFSLYGQCKLDDLIIYGPDKKIFVSNELKGISSPLLNISQELEFSSDFKIGKVEEILNGVIIWVKFSTFSEINIPLKGINIRLKNDEIISLSDDRLFIKGEITKTEENIKLLGESIKSSTNSRTYCYFLNKDEMFKLSDKNITKISFQYINQSTQELETTDNRKLSSRSAKKIKNILNCLITELGI